MKIRTLVIALAALALPAFVGADPTYYGGAASWSPGNGYDAPIFRQFAFVDDVVTQYHVLTPEAFPTDDRHSNAYQFPLCDTLRPVFEKLDPIPGHPLPYTDSPTRQIVDVVLSTGCMVQPVDVADVAALAVSMVERKLFVNAPVVPSQLATLTDEQLFNGPPYRPRLTAFQAGQEVQFITYEVSWSPLWVNTNFPSQDADVYIISYGALYRPGFSILNVAAGTPLHKTQDKYSPIWNANCIVDADDPKCMLSVNLQDPSYYQCTSVFECLEMVNSAGNQVMVTEPNTFTHINCPMVSVDVSGDNYVDIFEEIPFPNVWLDGPILV